MTQVDRKEFYEFLKDKDYIIERGDIFHSEYYVDRHTGIKIAYIETSSYGAPDLFMIND